MTKASGKTTKPILYIKKACIEITSCFVLKNTICFVLNTLALNKTQLLLLLTQF